MKNKIIDLTSKIMSKRRGIFIGKCTTFFSNAGKTGNMPEFKLVKF